MKCKISDDQSPVKIYSGFVRYLWAILLFFYSVLNIFDTTLKKNYFCK